MRQTNKQLTINNVPILNYSLSNGQLVYSDPIYQPGNIGFASLLSIVSSGQVGITYQVSLDGINWYTPNTNSAGVLTAAGLIVNSQTSTAWIILQAILAKYVRFGFYATGTTTISEEYIWQNHG